jgi:hypothetical protein
MSHDAAAVKIQELQQQEAGQGSRKKEGPSEGQ